MLDKNTVVNLNTLSHVNFNPQSNIFVSMTTCTAEDIKFLFYIKIRDHSLFSAILQEYREYARGRG